MNGIAGPRQVIAYLGNLGSSLPTAVAQHRGNFFWKRAAGAEDELYAGVRDSSGVNQLRRILTKTYADALYQPLGETLVTSVVRQIAPDPNATTWQTSLMAAPTPTASSTANADDATGGAIQLNTSTVSANVASLVAGTGGIVRGDWNWELEGLIARASTNTSSHRIWFGLFASTPSGSSDPSGVSGAGFLLATDVSGFIQAWSNDATSTGTTTNTAISTTAGTRQRWRLRSDGTNIEFFVDDVLAATHTSQHPVAATYHTVGVYCTTLTNAARGVQIGRITLAHDR
jgi:hypothetical protein